MVNCVPFIGIEFTGKDFLFNKNVLKKNNSKICTLSKIEKHLSNFHKNFSECIDCNSKRELKRCYENRDKQSNQRKIYYEKNEHKGLQKQSDRCIHFRELVKTCFESENRLKAFDEKAHKNSS